MNKYEAAGDVSASILRAPMVIASWIQPVAFAANNNLFGCEDMALCNRGGTIGVVLLNGGGIPTGLANLSVHAPDGSWDHKPLRLQVIVKATVERVDSVLVVKPAIAQLVDNGWVWLFALNPDGADCHLRTGGGG